MSSDSDINNTSPQAKRKRTPPPGPNDVSQFPGDGPTQPNLMVYPAVRMGDRDRRFNKKFYALHSWCEYSVSLNRVFCFACRHYGRNLNASTAWTTVGFGKYDSIAASVKAHETSLAHTSSSTAWTEHKRCLLMETSVVTLVHKTHRDEVLKNRQYIMDIIGLVLYLGRNGLAFRGHREGATAVDAHGNMADRGNFLEGMDLLSTHSTSIRERLAKGPHNQKYLHHDIQNELLHCASSIIRQQVAKEVSLAGCYSLSADETKDLSKVEQVAVSIRYVSDGGIQEEFIGFGAASDDLSAAGLTTVISAMLKTVGIDINGMVGMAFDGASVMSGQHRGVQQQLREKQDVPKAIYVHCFAHRLNLVLSEVCQSVDRVRLALDTIQAVYVFFSGSTVQNAYQRHLADMGDEFKKYRIQSQSETRWYARCVAVSNILKVMPAVHDTLIEQSECHKDSKRRATASGLLLTVDTHLIINLSIMEWILNKVDILSRQLQAHDATFSAARNLINTLVEELAPLNPPHADPRFDGIWERAEAVIQESDLPAPPQRRVRRVRRAAAANAGQEGYIRNFEGPDDWRRIVFNPMLRALIAEIETRYALDNDGVLTGIDALNPQLHDSFLELDLLQPMAERFHIDCAPLRPQVETCKLMVAKMRADGHPAIASVDSLSEFYRFLIPHKDSLFCLYELAKIAVTLPISSAGCERSFSVMKRVKTWLRTTMTHERLSDCGILAMSRGRTKGLETEDGLNQVLDAFVTRGERRMDLIL